MQSCDVVVIGAGFSGLAAARDLRAGGASVLVLEASSRVGGRTHTLRESGRWIELGGQWAGPGQRRVLNLAERHGVGTFETPHFGVDLLVSDGMVMPGAEAPGAAAASDAIAQLDSLVTELTFEEPWRASNAAAWDTQTVGSWLSTHVRDAVARARLRQYLSGLMTVPVDDMSVLTLLHAGRTSGSLSAALGIEGGAQELRFLGGMHQLAEYLAKELDDLVLLECPVAAIDDEPSQVVVHSVRGDVTAQRVVVSLPPSALSAVTIVPTLPTPQSHLPEWMPMGAVIKLHAIFARPFWRDAGWSGLVTDDNGPFAFMVDNSAPDSAEGALTTFLSARQAIEWGDAQLGPSAADRRRELLSEHIRRIFGAGTPELIDYIDRDWVAQPWIGGGYSGAMRPGGWLACGPSIREPVGRLHWASAERATEWTGYVEGALESGERAAREALERLD